MSTTDGLPGAASPASGLDHVARAQKRTLTVLVIAQVCSGAGLAAGITVGALLAQDMLDSTGWSGLPSALFTFGSAGAALAVGRLSQRWGRRPGLAAGYAAGAIGSLGIVAAAVLDNVALLFVALLVYGSGTATNLQARYAGADLAHPAHRARAISTVLVATTVGAVAGPRMGLAAIVSWLGLAALGAPVLANGNGAAAFVGPTAGVLFSFPIAGFLAGVATRTIAKSHVSRFGAFITLHLLILAMGWAWLATIIGPEAAFLSGVVPFIVGGVIKSALGAAILAALDKNGRSAK